MKQTNRIPAIILAEGPNGLGAVRSLYKENIPVEIISFIENDPSRYSRLPQKKSIVERNKDLLLSFLLAQANKKKVIIPTSDWCVNFIVEFQTQLKEKYDFVLPHANLSSQFIDKKIEVELVKQWTDVPKSVLTLPKTPEALNRIIGFPIIIKPRSNEMNYLGKKNIIANNPTELAAFYREFGQVIEYCIAQEVILGNDDTLWVCNCVFDQNSNLINAFTFQRLHLAPAHFGVTSYAISKHNPEVITNVERLGKGLNYIGPAMVEFKFDKKDRIYKYIEVNPRLGLCNYFDTVCGKNNVYATYCLAKGLNFTEQPQKENRMFLSVYEDLYSRTTTKQSVFSILKTYSANILKPHNFIYFAWCDPWPAFRIAFSQSKLVCHSIIKKITRHMK